MRNLCRYENRREKMIPEEVRAYWTERSRWRIRHSLTYNLRDEYRRSLRVPSVGL